MTRTFRRVVVLSAIAVIVNATIAATLAPAQEVDGGCGQCDSSCSGWGAPCGTGGACTCSANPLCSGGKMCYNP